MMNQTIDGGQGYGLIGKNPSPFAEGLIGGDQHRSPLVSRADQFEQNAGFRLILGDIGEVVENQQMVFVELGDRRLEHEIAPRDLEFLHEVGGSGEQHAPALFDQRQAERRGQMRFSAAGRGRDMAPVFWRVKRRSTTPSILWQGRPWRRRAGASCTAASNSLRFA